MDTTTAKKFRDLQPGDIILSYTDNYVKLLKVTDFLNGWLTLEGEDIEPFVGAGLHSWTLIDDLWIWSDPEQGIEELWKKLQRDYISEKMNTLQCLEWIQKINDITEEYVVEKSR